MLVPRRLSDFFVGDLSFGVGWRKGPRQNTGGFGTCAEGRCQEKLDVKNWEFPPTRLMVLHL